MKIFLFDRTHYDYDEVDGIVIKAENIDVAKAIARRYDWSAEYDEEEVCIEEIDLDDGVNEAIFSSYNAG